jgi:hypothetical protein
VRLRFVRGVVLWRSWSGHFAFQLSEPAVGTSEDFRGVALVAAIFGDGAARDGPFEVVQEPGERSSRLQGFKQRSPVNTVHQLGKIERGGRFRRRGTGNGSWTVSSLSCSFLQPFKDHIPWCILPIPPAPDVFEQRVIDVGAIRQDHISKGAPVLVVAVGLDGDFFPED